MAVRVADSLKQQNDLKTFPVAYSEDIWLDENKGEGDANYKDLQTLFNENKLGGSGLPEPESADKVLLSASSNTRADGLEWKQVSKNDVGMQLPEFESLDEWNNLPADEKSKYYNAGKGYVVIKEDVKGAKGVIDDTKLNSTVTTLSAKKISDSLEDKADKNAVLNSLEVANGNRTAQIIPWTDGTHYRGFEDKSSKTYTDIITKDGVASIAKIENGVMTKLEELATTDNVPRSKNRINEQIVTMDNLDNTKTGMSIDFDGNSGQIRLYVMKNGVSQKVVTFRSV